MKARLKAEVAQRSGCGGPLLCRYCAMAWAQEFHEQGHTYLAEVYRHYAILLRKSDPKARKP